MKTAFLIQLLAALSTPPAGVQNAKVTVRAAGPGGLAAEVRAAAPGPFWIGYAQPVLDGPRQMCCFGSVSGTFRGHSKTCCGGCRLENESSFSIGHDAGTAVSLETSLQFRVLLRVQNGAVGKVRAFSEDCALDAGGLPFLLLTGVSPRESLDVLGGLAGSLTGGDRIEDQVGQVLAAIALHADPGADAILEKLAARGSPLELRKQAAFWLGNERGRRGFEILRAATADPDTDFRQHLTFCLSQSPVPEALTTLIRMARHDPEGEVRGQALFWLAQKAGDRAAETIRDAIREDPEEEVKKKAVFALSQLNGDQAVTELIRVARTNRNPEVRKQAIFWLGQSGDPRALDFIEKILAN